MRIDAKPFSITPNGSPFLAFCFWLSLLGTNLLRKLATPSGSGAQMTIVIGYNEDRVPSDCNKRYNVNDKQMSVDELIVNDAKYIAGRDSPNGKLANVPLMKIERGISVGDNNRRRMAEFEFGNGEDDLADATVDENHRELPSCRCSPGGNCEACCLGTVSWNYVYTTYTLFIRCLTRSFLFFASSTHTKLFVHIYQLWIVWQGIIVIHAILPEESSMKLPTIMSKMK